MNPGDSLDGRYTILEQLGAGGMGEVYKATHTFLGATRVIKIVRPQIAGNQDAQERFLREARAATKIHHPNVATLYDFAALPDGAHYMVWEFIDGENLAQRLRARGTVPVRQALRVTIQALQGLDAIHRAGIVHRDISPENLMITHADDAVKIIDLGVAKVDDANVAQTRTGIFVGKLRYASPEQLGFMGEEERIDGRTDIYSLAMVLVELLTGRPPYEAKSPHEYFILHAREAQQNNTVELPVELAGSAALRQVLEKALHRDRGQRYANAREFAAVLEEIERTLPEQRDLPTMETALDGDATMRVAPQTQADTLHRSTVRTDAPAAAAPAVAAVTEATVLTPLPAAAPHVPHVPPAGVPAPVKRSNLVPLLIVLFVVFAVLGGAFFFLFRPGAEPAEVATATTASVATTTVAPPPVASQTSVTVTSPPVLVEPTPALSSTVPPTSTAPRIAVSDPIPATATRAPDPRPAPERVVESETPSDSDENDPEPSSGGAFNSGGSASRLRTELRGTRRVALRAGGNQVELARALRRSFPELQFEAHAPVVIRYDRRSSSGTVLKNGRVIFSYDASSPEDFARAIADALN